MDLRVAATQAGPVEGSVEDGVARFFGIPFAAPPIGPDGRWRAPGPVDPWGSGAPRPAHTFGFDCPQPPGATSRAPGQSEDCLTLNVWAPADADGGPARDGAAPVLVWFYGGSFLFGSGSDPVCDGTNLARRGAVVVTANYRVGLFGFLAHPDLPTANVGLLDMIAALDWVRANIAAFGGDPANVTAFGVSAGSASLSLLLTSPLAEGRFDRLILQSPGSFRPLATMADAQAAAMEAFGPSIEPWLSVPAQELLAETGRLAPKVRRLMAPRVLRPIADGTVVPHDERLAYATGAFHRVPVLVGGNLDEGGRLTAGWPIATVDAWRDLLALEFGSRADEAARLWPVDSADEVPIGLGELFGDTQFSLGARAIAKAVAATGTPAWRYLFARPRPVAPGVPGDGPHHGEEVPYVFGTLDSAFGSAAGAPPAEAADRALSEAMMGAWLRFAATGDPNGDPDGDLPRWPPVGADDGEPYLVLDEVIEVGQGHRRPQLDFLDWIATSTND